MSESVKEDSKNAAKMDEDILVPDEEGALASSGDTSSLPDPSKSNTEVSKDSEKEEMKQVVARVLKPHSLPKHLFDWEQLTLPVSQCFRQEYDHMIDLSPPIEVNRMFTRQHCFVIF